MNVMTSVDLMGLDRTNFLTQAPCHDVHRSARWAPADSVRRWSGATGIKGEPSAERRGHPFTCKGRAHAYFIIFNIIFTIKLKIVDEICIYIYIYTHIYIYIRLYLCTLNA